MKAIVYDAPRNFSYRDTADPKVTSDEILVRIHACGLCGTDLHIHEGEFGPRFPLIPGHEFTGEIVELGAEVSGFGVENLNPMQGARSGLDHDRFACLKIVDRENAIGLHF